MIDRQEQTSRFGKAARRRGDVRLSDIRMTVPALLAAFIVFMTAGIPPAIAANATAEQIQPITLIDHNGHTVTQKDFAGKPSLVFFGFTNCPSICPTALAEISQRLSDLGPLADQLNVIFITADPERDTPEILHEYLGYFDTRIIGLSGDLTNISAMAKSLGAQFKKVPLEGGGYTVDHSSFGFLTDRNMQRSGLLVIGQGADPALANAKLRDLIGAVTAAKTQ